LPISAFCLFEAYGVISRKWKKKEIDADKYFHAIYILSSLSAEIHNPSSLLPIET
jgi:hypothetical protein